MVLTIYLGSTSHILTHGSEEERTEEIGKYFKH